jgi:hypothetical protein
VWILKKAFAHHLPWKVSGALTPTIGHGFPDSLLTLMPLSIAILHIALCLLQ